MSFMLFLVNVSAIDSSSDFNDSAVSRGIVTVVFIAAAREERSNSPNVIGTLSDGCIHEPSFCGVNGLFTLHLPQRGSFPSK